MSDPLRELRIWITRPEPAAQESIRRWNEAGASARAVPLLSLKAIFPPTERLESVRATEPRPLVVFTSAPAAEHFARVLGVASGERRPWDCVVVGERTAERARALGLQVRWVSQRATGVDLAEELLSRVRPSRVLLPGSNLRRNDVENRLRSGGCEVDVLTLYETQARHELTDTERGLIEAGQVDVVAFYSPSAVRAWLDLGSGVDATALQRPAMVALGPTTADEIRTHGLRLVATPNDPDEKALIVETARWWQREGPRR